MNINYEFLLIRDHLLEMLNVMFDCSLLGIERKSASFTLVLVHLHADNPATAAHTITHISPIQEKSTINTKNLGSLCLLIIYVCFSYYVYDYSSPPIRCLKKK